MLVSGVLLGHYQVWKIKLHNITHFIMLINYTSAASTCMGCHIAHLTETFSLTQQRLPACSILFNL